MKVRGGQHLREKSEPVKVAGIREQGTWEHFDAAQSAGLLGNTVYKLSCGVQAIMQCLYVAGMGQVVGIWNQKSKENMIEIIKQQSLLVCSAHQLAADRPDLAG